MAYFHIENAWKKIKFEDFMCKVCDLSNVVGLLSYGIFFGESRKKLIICQVIGTALCMAIMGLGITLLSIDQISDPDPIAEYVLYIILYIIAFSLLPSLLLVILIKNEKMRNKVQLWMDDAVILKAKSRKIDCLYQLGIPCPKIEVNFSIDGLQYERQSKSIGAMTIKQGYHFIWSRYVNREITIAYSPRYDEVMVLKDKKLKKA